MRWTTPRSSTSSSRRSSALLERHLATAKEWFPHELVPYSRGRDFVPGEAWTEDDADLGGVDASTTPCAASLFVNLLTEDNLPYYFRTIERMFGADGAWGTWARRWTAEEGRHSMVDLRLPDGHPGHRPGRPRAGPHGPGVAAARCPSPTSPADGLVYVALQELATRIAHRNTGKLLGDPAGYEVMTRVAADENLHHLFYRDLATAALELDPSARWCSAIERQVVELRDARHRHPRLRRPRRGDRQGRHLRLRRSTTTRSSCRSCCATGASSRSRASTPRPSRPATADGPPRQERARRPPHRRAPPRAHVRLNTRSDAPRSRSARRALRRRTAVRARMASGSDPPSCEHGP